MDASLNKRRPIIVAVNSRALRKVKGQGFVPEMVNGNAMPCCHRDQGEEFEELLKQV